MPCVECNDLNTVAEVIQTKGSHTAAQIITALEKRGIRRLRGMLSKLIHERK